MPVEVTIDDLLHLGLTFEEEIDNPRAVAKRLIKDGVVKTYRHASAIFILATNNRDDCYSLDQSTRKCSVYDRRPNVCRDFPLKRSSRIGYCPKIRKV